MKALGHKVGGKSVATELTNNQAFDDYAAQFGWDYDNSGWYLGLAWDRYASNPHRWDRQPDGTVHHVVAIMRRERTTVAAVHFQGLEPTEIWSGDIRTGVEFDRLLEIIADYMKNWDTGEWHFLKPHSFCPATGCVARPVAC